MFGTRYDFDTYMIMIQYLYFVVLFVIRIRMGWVGRGCFCKRGTHLGDRETTGAVLLSAGRPPYLPQVPTLVACC